MFRRAPIPIDVRFGRRFRQSRQPWEMAVQQPPIGASVHRRQLAALAFIGEGRNVGQLRAQDLLGAVLGIMVQATKLGHHVLQTAEFRPDANVHVSGDLTQGACLSNTDPGSTGLRGHAGQLLMKREQIRFHDAKATQPALVVLDSFYASFRFGYGGCKIQRPGLPSAQARNWHRIFLVSKRAFLRGSPIWNSPTSPS